MENKEMRYCNQCPNHCPEDSLKCGRGRNYFSRVDDPDTEDHGEERREECRSHGREERREGRHSHDEEYRREGGWHGHGGEGKKGDWHGHGDKDGKKGGWHGHGGESRKEGGWHGHGSEEEGGERRRGGGPHLDQNDLYSMMRFCGHYLYHRSGSDQGAGQERILSILSNKGSITQKELQTILKIQPGSMSEILAKLEEKGMISRKKDEEDKRKSIIELTEEGHKAGGQSKIQPKDQLFDALDEGEQEALKQLLVKLTDSWKD